MDFSTESHVESVRPPHYFHPSSYLTSHKQPGSRDRALIEKLKEALKPGDARIPTTQVDTTPERIREPDYRGYDGSGENMSLWDENGGGGGRKSSLLDQIHFTHGREQAPGHHRQSRIQGESRRYGGGGFMHALKEMMSGAGPGVNAGASVGSGSGTGHHDKKPIERFRDATDSTHVDVGRLPGNLYASLRE